MPKQFSYTSNDGVEHPESYWKLTELEINRFGSVATVIFCGWHNKESRDSGYAAISGASIKYQISGEDFVEVFSVNELDLEASNPYKKAYEYAEQFEPFLSAITVDV